MAVWGLKVPTVCQQFTSFIGFKISHENISGKRAASEGGGLIGLTSACGGRTRRTRLIVFLSVMRLGGVNGDGRLDIDSFRLFLFETGDRRHPSYGKATTRTPEFCVFAHYAKTIKPGAARLEDRGDWAGSAIVARNPPKPGSKAGDVAIVVMNSHVASRQFKVRWFPVLLKMVAFVSILKVIDVYTEHGRCCALTPTNSSSKHVKRTTARLGARYR